MNYGWRAMEKIEVGVIGLGNFARSQHLPNLARIPEARLRAVCDIDEALAGEIRAKYAAGYATVDYRRVLDDKDIVMVVLAVRDSLQAPMALDALRAGKHVYVEKPLAETPDACAQVLDGVRASGLRLAVGFNKRFAPIYRLSREIMRADGGARNAHLRMADDAWRWAASYPPGFLLRLDICHLFDLLRWFTGADIESVCCAGTRPDDDSLLVRMTDGCVASILSSGHGSMDMPKERVDVITRRGGLSAEDFVELSTFGYPDFEASYTFAGHSDPGREFMHKYLMEKMGMSAWRAIRRMTWELGRRVENSDTAPGGDSGDMTEMRRFVGQTIPNFMRDQGWLASLRAFLRGLIDNQATDHAGAEDALQASRAAKAAELSRETGKFERLS
jgi:predicted dehydrogenase